MEDGVKLSKEQQRRRRNRSWALGLCLGTLVVVFYVITVFKLGPDILNRGL